MNIPLSSLPPWALVTLGVVALAQLTLDILALVDLYRRPADRVLAGNKWIWVAVILLANFIGAILYLVVARKPAAADEATTDGMTPSVSADSVADSLYGPRGTSGPR